LNSLSTKTAPDRSLRAYFWWATTIAWAATIFRFSTVTYAGWFTAWLLHGILDFLHISLSPAGFEALHNLIRKLAHVTEYTVFGLLLYGSFSGGRDFSWRSRTALLCFAIAALYSLTDEFHQWFVPGRGASLVDCGIDASGVALGLILLYLRHRLSPSKKA
jgi:VanZ family protein